MLLGQLDLAEQFSINHVHSPFLRSPRKRALACRCCDQLNHLPIKSFKINSFTRNLLPPTASRAIFESRIEVITHKILRDR